MIKLKKRLCVYFDYTYNVRTKYIISTWVSRLSCWTTRISASKSEQFFLYISNCFDWLEIVSRRFNFSSSKPSNFSESGEVVTSVHALESCKQYFTLTQNIRQRQHILFSKNPIANKVKLVAWHKCPPTRIMVDDKNYYQ